MKKYYLLLALSLCFVLPACSGSGDTSSDSNTSNMSNGQIVEEPPKIEDSPQEVISAPESMYFESDEVIDKFFSDYNAIAEVVIPVDEIERGNIRTKALIYIDDLSLEVINAKEFLSISMSSAIENEDTKLYAIFRDSIMAMRTDTAEEDIQSVWSTIHESGYLVEDYDFDGISITYVPAKELSRGTSNLRVDLEIPFS